jgi:DNA-binding transcriptional regulator GbsR (MarR family)
MSSLQEVKTGFIRIYEDIMRARGLPTIMGRIMAVMLLEGRELNHKEISSLTGYSMASVNRTLNQLVTMGIIHKHKDPQQKYYVFHISIDYPQIFAESIEKFIKIYETQRKEIGNLTQKLKALESEGTNQAEIKRLRTVIKNFDRILEATMEVLEKMAKDLRQLKDTPTSLDNTSQ